MLPISILQLILILFSILLLIEMFESSTLRVDHQRPPPGVGDDDRVVDRERVDRQAVHVPRPDLDRVAHGRTEGERDGARDAGRDARLRPLCQALLAEIGGERTQVGDDCR